MDNIYDAPWTVGAEADGGVRQVVAADGEAVVAEVWPMGEDFDDLSIAPNRERSARLIAKAPEMAAVCEAVLTAWHANTRNMERAEPQHVTAARAILAAIDGKEGA